MKDADETSEVVKVMWAIFGCLLSTQVCQGCYATQMNGHLDAISRAVQTMAEKAERCRP